MKPGYLLIVILIGVGSSAQAAIYKWEDADGNVHYGDRPAVPQSKELKPARTPTGAPNDRQRQEKTQRLLDAFEAERAESRAAEAERKQAAAERQERCADARDRLRGYLEAGHVYRLDEQGNRVVLPESERQASIERARKAVEDNCGQ